MKVWLTLMLPSLATTILFSTCWAFPQSSSSSFLFPGQLEKLEENATTTELTPTQGSEEELRIHIIEREDGGEKREDSSKLDKETIREMYEEALKACVTEGDKMPSYDKDKKEYVCHTLLEQGPCAEDEWFVAIPDLPVPIAKCQPRPCDGLDSLVPVEGEKGCKLLYGSSDCAPGMEMLPNPYGKGECDCKEGNLRHYDSKGFLYCYQEYLQGPCEEGQQYVLPFVFGDDQEPTCAPTDCPSNQIRLRDICVPVPAQCSVTEYVQFDLEKLTSTCVDENATDRRQLVVVPSSCDDSETYDPVNKKCVRTRTSGSSLPKRFALGSSRNLLAYLASETSCFGLSLVSKNEAFGMHFNYSVLAWALLITNNHGLGFRIKFPHSKGVDCEEINQVEWTDGKCYSLFDQGPCRPGEEFVAVPASPLGFGCRALTCPPQTVPYGLKCEKIGEHSQACLPMFVMWVTPQGNGICGCPPYYEFAKGACVLETDQKTVFSFPKECDEGLFLVNNEECLPVTKAAHPEERNIKKRQFLVIPDQTKRLISFLRVRG